MSLVEVGDILRDVFEVTADIILSPSKRLNFGYLFTSALLALFVFIRLKPSGSFVNYIFNTKVWLSRSSQLDLQIVVFNGFVTIIYFRTDEKTLNMRFCNCSCDNQTQFESSKH